MRWTNILLLVCLVLLVVEVDSKKKPKKKPKKPKPAAKGVCFTKGPKPSPKLFAKYTKKGEKCPCWWDITRDDCACCTKSEYQQCGWPMHKFCYKKEPKGKPQYGCPGVCNNEFTLSGKGYPCSSDHSNKDCAWCTSGNYQCAQDKLTGPDSKEGSRCTSKKNKNYCSSQQGDCKHIPACDAHAECKLKKKIGRYVSDFQCECGPGYTGNGIQCMDSNGTLSLPADTPVEVTMNIMKEEYTYPYTIGEFGLGEKLESLIAEMGSVAAGSCNSDACEASFNQTDTLN